jgi:hypothetical protein
VGGWVFECKRGRKGVCVCVCVCRGGVLQELRLAGNRCVA